MPLEEPTPPWDNDEPEQPEPTNQEVAIVCPSCGAKTFEYAALSPGWSCSRCSFVFRGNAD